MRVRGGLFAALVMFAAPAVATLAAVAVSAPALAQTVDAREIFYHWAWAKIVGITLVWLNNVISRRG